MARIAILDDTLASQVAAGEVIERPASVVKELVENSLDAGASHITVEIQRGGTALIRVTDDARGMSREDALMSLERHATSKLQSSDQLASILTLGFRGEAVPSIASVGRFRMTSRERGSVSGTEVIVDGGRLGDVKEAGVPEGTSVELKQIFYNIPARRKFLRAETTESAHVEHQVRLHALAAPGVRFTYIKDGRRVFDLPATEDWRVRITGLTGPDAASQLIEISQRSGRAMTVRGYLLPAEFARKGRKPQFVFLNGRPVEDAAISRALRDGFRGALQDGSHPTAWLWIEMDPTLVDVNVHPAKKEVRFHRPQEIRTLVVAATEEALQPKKQPQPFIAPERGKDVVSPSPVGEEYVESEVSNKAAEVEAPARQVPAQEASPRNDQVGSERASIAPDVGSGQAPQHFPHHVEKQEELPAQDERPMVQAPSFKIIGPLHNRYVVLEGDEGVVLLDPVAARERIAYEYLLAGVSEEGVASQGLLVPELLELDTLDAELVMRHVDHFADAGFVVESFGGNTVKVSGVPSFLGKDDVRRFLLEIVDELASTVGTRKGKSIAYEAFAAGVAGKVGLREPCRADLAQGLLEKMFLCDLPYCTPDGRPTLIHISLNELDRKFGK
ncbi:MAG: DNA mismatch repair endonuclease MutL [Akkermansiaceae bacterium]